MGKKNDGPAGQVLVDALNSDGQLGEPIDGLAGELRDLHERWDNRLVLENVSLAETYINGRLEIVLYGDWENGLNDTYWAIRVAARRAIPHDVRADASVDVANFNYRNDRGEIVMLPVFVEGVKTPQMLVWSVFRSYLFKKSIGKIGKGVLYRRETGMGYEVFPWTKWEIERPLGALASGVHYRDGREVESLSNIVECITDDASKCVTDIDFGPILEAINGGIAVNDRFGYFDRVVCDFVKFPIQRSATSPQFVNVAVGPLDL